MLARARTQGQQQQLGVLRRHRTDLSLDVGGTLRHVSGAVPRRRFNAMRRAGLEPATPRLVIGNSIQLSYRRLVQTATRARPLVAVAFLGHHVHQLPGQVYGRI
jgi:hypothetical protein